MSVLKTMHNCDIPFHFYVTLQAPIPWDWSICMCWRGKERRGLEGRRTTRRSGSGLVSIPKLCFEKQTSSPECLPWPGQKQIDDLQSGFVIALFALAVLESSPLIAAPDVYSVNTHTQIHVRTHMYIFIYIYT